MPPSGRPVLFPHRRPLLLPVRLVSLLPLPLRKPLVRLALLLRSCRGLLCVALGGLGGFLRGGAGRLGAFTLLTVAVQARRGLGKRLEPASYLTHPLSCFERPLLLLRQTPFPRLAPLRAPTRRRLLLLPKPELRL